MSISTLLFQPTQAKQTWGQLHGSSLALALAEYCQQTSGIKLLIAQDNLSANQLQAELTFFLNSTSSQELLFFLIGKHYLMINFPHIRILFLNDCML
ncbi:Transcription-repair coupling factor [Legionella sainthelensi]|nr:hypothetical protein [Legionella sainthelensi]VEH34520.1 Transcription-repair coupling factor [Legionella sainthelensi]